MRDESRKMGFILHPEKVFLKSKLMVNRPRYIILSDQRERRVPKTVVCKTLLVGILRPKTSEQL